METVTTLFALADKCARAAEGSAWHSAPQDGAAQMGGPGATAHSSSDEEKSRSVDRPQSGAPVAAIAPVGQNSRSKRPRQQGRNSGSCPVHPGGRHNASECHEILAKHVSKRREQASSNDLGDQHGVGR